MKIYVQWSLDTPETWREYDSSEWALLPAKPIPTGGEIIDAGLGWITSISVQGINFTGDHFAVEDHVDFLDVFAWWDDPDDYPPEWQGGHRYRFYPPTVKENRWAEKYWDTNIEHELYGGTLMYDQWNRPIEGSVTKRIGEFIPPPINLIRHGIWLPDDLYEAHSALQGPVGWHQYCEGGWEPPEFAVHSITYLLNAPDALDSGCTPATDFNRKMDETGQVSGLLASNYGGSVSKISHAFTSEAGDPGDGDWPTASGGDPYECSMDTNDIGADVTFGLLTQGTANGEFTRVNSGCTRQEGFVQGEGAFNATGVNVATNTSVNPSAGASSDRFQVRIAGVRGINHGNQPLTFDMTSSSFGKGPWAAAAAPFSPRPIVVTQARNRASSF